MLLENYIYLLQTTNRLDNKLKMQAEHKTFMANVNYDTQMLMQRRNDLPLTLQHRYPQVEKCWYLLFTCKKLYSCDNRCHIALGPVKK